MARFHLERTKPTACSPSTLVSAASTFIGVDDEPYLRRHFTRCLINGASVPPDAPWGTAFVSHVGHTSHQYGGMGHSAWPLPLTASVGVLARFALTRGIAYEEPEPGDVALFRSRETRQYHTAGIVVAMTLLESGAGGRPVELRVTTIEGNVTPDGRPGGAGVYRVRHTIMPWHRTMFVRWAALDPRGADSEPERLPVHEMGRTVVRRCA